MMETRPTIWIWQTEVSPHVGGLANALAQMGCDVVFLAPRWMSGARAAMGWTTPELGGARVELIPSTEAVTAAVAAAPPLSIHIGQGIRANGLIGIAQRALAKRGLRQWVMLETVDGAGLAGIVRRLEYFRQFSNWRRRLDGVLAIGHSTSEWVTLSGVSPGRVFPFAYFLPEPHLSSTPRSLLRRRGPLQILFVGRMDERKRADLLIDALGSMDQVAFDLHLVGKGPLESELRTGAEGRIPGRATFHGLVAMPDLPGVLAEADCLVLPSDHDGWGSVIVEAMMVGTPVICSDHCGAAGVVRSSRAGGVFRAGNTASLADLLRQTVARGAPSASQRAGLAAWARCLGATAGARYLVEILEHVSGRGSRPLPPWERDNPVGP